MGSLYFLLGLGTLLYFLIGGHHRSSIFDGGNVKVGVEINGASTIAMTDEEFVCATLDWWPPEKCDYGVCSWGRASLLNLDLNNKILNNAVKAFSPLKIRMGGTLQDKVIYETDTSSKLESCKGFVKEESMFSFSHGCLPMSRWDELNAFFNDTGAVVTFGLNALAGRTIAPDGLAVGAWDSTNAESLIRYTAEKGYKIHGWELGNELCGTGIGARVMPHRYASDAMILQNLIQEIYKGNNQTDPPPLVIAPGGFFEANWFYQFMTEATNSVQVITQHIYNLGAGVDRATDLINRILDPLVLNSAAHFFTSMGEVISSSGTKAVAWVGEAGGAFNSGHHLVTDAFVMSFWYLDQLGTAASYDTKTYCRQTLIGGNYGLLNTSTFQPNPDYYSALLWHRLMGKQVLSSTVLGTENIRAYAHCSKQSQGVTLLVLNLDRKKTAHVSLTADSAGISASSYDKSDNKKSTFSATRTRKMNLPGVVPITEDIPREEYHLTAPNGDLHSQTVQLNGKPLSVTSSSDIPPLEPENMKSSSKPIIVSPLSIVFVHMPGLVLPACR